MSVTVARRIMSKMPDVVFDMWLRPIIGRIGWPFGSELSSTFGTEWHRLFLQRGIQVIANLRWERRDLPFVRIPFASVSQSTIDAMLSHHVFGNRNPSLDAIPDSFDRFVGIQDFIRRHGKIPAPCVLMLDVGAYSILDGHHRIGALASLPNAPLLSIDCWVGG